MRGLIFVLAVVCLTGCGITAGQVTPASVCDVRRQGCAVLDAACVAFGSGNQNICVEAKKACDKAKEYCGPFEPEEVIVE